VISSSDHSFRYSIGILTAFLDNNSRRSFTSYIFPVFRLRLSRSKCLYKTSFFTTPIISSAVHLWWVRLTRMPDLFPHIYVVYIFLHCSDSLFYSVLGTVGRIVPFWFITY